MTARTPEAARPIWDDREPAPEDLRRKPVTTQPCRFCSKLVTATASKLRPFCGWRCSEAWTELSARFLRKVGPPTARVPGLSPCTDWTGKLDDEGYGKIRHNDTFRLAHRVSYELAHGSVPADLMICHKCNRRTCVNIEHLYAGTAQDNARDLAIANSGSGSKTEWEDRLSMAQAIADGADPEYVGACFGVSGKTASSWYVRFQARDRVPEHLSLRGV